MIFLTVGTLFPFDRLVKAIDALVLNRLIKDDIFAQIGKGAYIPKTFSSSGTLDKEVFDLYFARSDFVISHAGMGTIIMALEYSKPLLVMPRMRKYREAVNDHQIDTARRFEKLGHLLAVYDSQDIPEKINILKSFKPIHRVNQTERVAARIGAFLDQIKHE